MSPHFDERIRGDRLAEEMEMKKFKVVLCPKAAEEHLLSARQYAHVFHYPNAICVAPEIFDLPPCYLAGILIHEIGHLALSGKAHTEDDADREAEALSGIPIERLSYRKTKNLECIPQNQIWIARDFLKKHTTLR